MSSISLVVAVSRNGVIGKAGGLPWHISSDLKLFKAITLGKPIIMGRKTWESLPRKPLPGRANIVITRQVGFMADGATVVSDVDSAISAAGDAEEIAVIGGGEIYKMFLPHANCVYYTEVDLDVEGDTYFPALSSQEWVETRSESYPRGDNDSAGFTLRVFNRKTKL